MWIRIKDLRDGECLLQWVWVRVRVRVRMGIMAVLRMPRRAMGVIRVVYKARDRQVLPDCGMLREVLLV
jgi:hypothetical protein